MSNGFLSQEEIDSLLNGGITANNETVSEENIEDLITDMDKDLLGEIGNISMGSASTALSQIINQPVNITTPVVSITTLKNLKKEFIIPNMVLEVEYTSGIIGRNVLVMKVTDSSVIANLMMGGDGKVNSTELTEIEISAVQEAMNQMIGSAATSMATMFAREVNISPPHSKIWNDDSEPLSDEITEDEPIVKVCFRMKIGTLVDSEIMQLLPVATAKKVVSIMLGTEEREENVSSAKHSVKITSNEEQKNINESFNDNIKQKEIERPMEKVEVHTAAFEPLDVTPIQSTSKNIDLILDVPLEISVVLGRTKKSIKEILNLGTGSLIELDKLAEEPVEILVNGKKVAYGEVVVVDENFGVRITNIVSNVDRVKSLKE
ncbi:flagellar motor switch protein FliN/FliY [Clostridium amylolyticum]|uniref:Flagellar motor switch protein FliN/FliY n=1 Tax=Clostridium amylolyticum TaxID=1121298 RepID=A0A1M6CCB1_9CLOT|nr:flagellar motor switch phosphatase FliY [Clostridium amylolyticum]SHI58639.1 flagellar motor switch protein FliN/FliY [Clostridium amylolyticum]